MIEDKKNKLVDIQVLIERAWYRYKSNFKRLVKVGAFPAICDFLFTLYVLSSISIFFVNLKDIFKGGIDTPTLLEMGMIFGCILILGLMTALIGVLKTIAQLYVLTDHTITIRGAYEKSTFSFYSFLWVSILVSLACLGGFVLFIIPGIIFAIWFLLSPFINVFEGLKGNDALVQSRSYAEGIFFPILVRIIVIQLLAIVIQFAASRLTVFVGNMTGDMMYKYILDSVYMLVATPYFIAAYYEVYLDIRKANQVLQVENK